MSIETAQIQSAVADKKGRKYETNEESIFINALKRYARYNLGKTPNNHRKVSPDALQQTMIMAVLQTIAMEVK